MTQDNTNEIMSVLNDLLKSARTESNVPIHSTLGAKRDKQSFNDAIDDIVAALEVITLVLPNVLREKGYSPEAIEGEISKIRDFFGANLVSYIKNLQTEIDT